jgi:hypothetical protein
LRTNGQSALGSTGQLRAVLGVKRDVSAFQRFAWYGGMICEIGSLCLTNLDDQKSLCAKTLPEVSIGPKL